MDLQRRRRVFALLRDLVDVPQAEQAAWIAGHADDEAMAAELRVLLQASGPAEALDGGAAGLVEQMDAASDPARGELAEGTHIDGWRVIRTLGRGGMGVVYLVERTGEDFRQSGALKLIRLGLDSADVLASFRRERRILSQLDHPHIARLLDGGIAGDGRPWLVMEYVDGEPLLAWAQARQATLDARVALFLQVCDAVAAAHRQLVVHRDIKPGNVLVDRSGAARLLDFGIAKVLEDDGGGERTATAARFLSRAYAAPEQLDDSPVSTVTDVFQLGLLLSELVSGAGPAQLGALASTRASQRLAAARSRVGAAGPAAITPAQLKGDAGIIASRACDADPARRYASVEALADDVRRWRDGRPILARPDSGLYRLQRFVGRHRVGTAFAVIAVLALVGSTAFALRQAQRAEREADLARSAQGFLTGIFDAAAPDSASGRRVTARELLDRGSERIRTAFVDQPRLRASMLLTLGSLYRQLGQFDEAADLLDEAAKAIALHDDADLRHRATLERAVVERERGNLEAAAALFEGLSDHENLPAALRATQLAERATLREKQGKFQTALDDARAAASIDLGLGDAATAALSRDRQIEGLALTRLGEFKAARAVFEQAIAGAVSAYGDEDTRVAVMRNDYAALLLNKGSIDDAATLIERALQARRARLDANHPAIAESLQVLGAVRRQQGRYDDAERSFAEALAIQRASLGPDHADIAVTVNSMGILALMRHRFDVAEGYFGLAIGINERNGQGRTPSTSTMLANRGIALMRLGRYPEAQAALDQSIAQHRSALGNDHPALMSGLNGLAQLHTREGKFADAEREARDSLRIAATAVGPGRDQAAVRGSLASVLLRKGDAQLAYDEAQSAIAMLDASQGGPDPRRYGAMAVQVDALLALGRVDEAAGLADQVLAARRERAAIEPASLVAALALSARVASARNAARLAAEQRAEGRRLLAAFAHPDPELELDLQR